MFHLNMSDPWGLYNGIATQLMTQYDELVLPIAPERGTGSLTSIRLRDGLTLVMNNCHFYEAMRIDFAIETPPFTLGCYLEGTTTWTSYDGRESHYADAGNYETTLLPDFQARSEFPAAQWLRKVELLVDPALLRTFVAESTSNLPSSLIQRLYYQRGSGYLRLRRMPPTIYSLAYQLLACPYHGATRRLYLESKALELLALHLVEEGVGTPQATWLRPDECARVQSAARILNAQMAEPPSLQELARAVTLNEHKLKLGFRQLFDTTVFGYLQRQRIAHARHLLDTRELNIAEVAATIGYANPAKFAAAFKRAVGITPRDYLNKSVHASVASLQGSKRSGME